MKELLKIIACIVALVAVVWIAAAAFLKYIEFGENRHIAYDVLVMYPDGKQEVYENAKIQDKASGVWIDLGKREYVVVPRSATVFIKQRDVDPTK